MRGMRTIAWRDFKTLVTSPMYMLVATACAIAWSYIFIRQVRNFAEISQGPLAQYELPNIFIHLFIPHISTVHLFLIFAVPVLTMRLISEEKKLRTFDLLLTSPITSTDIALGKFIAGFGATALLALISLLYPLIVVPISDFSWGMLLSSYLGVLLVLGVYVAVGLFTSSLTESAMVSVILALVVNITLWFIGQSAEHTESTAVFSILNQLSVPQNFGSFLKGAIKVNSTLFFLSLIAFFVFLAERVVESARWRA